MVDDPPAGAGRWKVVLAVRGAPDLVQSRLLLARLEGVSWYRRRGQLFVSVRVDADAQEAAEQAAVDVLGAAQLRATVVRSRHVRG